MTEIENIKRFLRTEYGINTIAEFNKIADISSGLDIGVFTSKIISTKAVC